MLALARVGCCVTLVQRIQVLFGSLRPFISLSLSSFPPPHFCRSMTLKAVWLQELQKQKESLRTCKKMLKIGIAKVQPWVYAFEFALLNLNKLYKE